MSSRIDFVIAGVQKAGTTALHAVLSAHPEVFIPARKELHFFDDDNIVDWRDPDYAFYERYFSGRLPSQICGEATPLGIRHSPYTGNPGSGIISPVDVDYLRSIYRAISPDRTPPSEKIFLDGTR